MWVGVRNAMVAAVALGVAGCGGNDREPAGTVTAPVAARPVTTTTAADPGPAPKLRPASCPAQLTAGYRCATLTVPLHRRGAQVRDRHTLTLDVALQRGRHPRGDFLLLSGGPGQPGRPFGPRMAQRLRAAAGAYRLVFLDQRGTGATAISCPALQRSAGTSDLAVPAKGAAAACGRKLGGARDAYATADTVADLDALRRALGAASWTVGGISYGTFVAERYALAHPSQTRALVLDSVVPQEGAELLERVPLRATARVLGPTATADLRRVLAGHPDLGPRLFDLITERSIGVPRLDVVPPALHAAATGDLAPLQALLAETSREERGGVPTAIYSTGLHAATLCADAPALWPGGAAAPAKLRSAAIDRLRTGLRPAETAPWPRSTALGQGLLATCRAWPPIAPPRAPARDAAIRTPAILLAGDRDLSTPLEWARAQQRHMTEAQLVVVPGAGHSILSREPGTAGRTALAKFLAAQR
ncbi:hypothetical protein DSM104299_01916 [Baekduia alba]|uniref:alpha/beta fold hydrolase n=1 Tax=Baekduia alba TaxID=2997333 RepID=UPI00233FE9F5|nr:alpha/beta hydrolase [Baekduia alba]WCB93209.1 hypothetical protein DSM104299_01916 [Baekduia alba]